MKRPTRIALPMLAALLLEVGTASAQIVVERAMYANDDAGVTWAAGTNAVATKLK